MTRLIGLTGGIATGKSAVSHYLKTKNIPVIDADVITHQVEEKGQAGYQAILTVFGDSIVAKDGHIDRQRLGKLVFSNKGYLKQLVRTIDPFIRDEILRQFIQNTQSPLTVLDAPTLFENGYAHIVDELVVVYCDPVTQLHRLMERNQLSISQASDRIKNQWPLQTKRNLADTIIYNSGTIDQTHAQVDDWLATETNQTR